MDNVLRDGPMNAEGVERRIPKYWFVLHSHQPTHISSLRMSNDSTQYVAK